MTVYADVLLAINTYVNFFLLLCTQKLSSNSAGKKRLLLGAFTGGVYSLSIFINGLPTAIKILMNAAALVLIVFIAFGPKSIKSFVKLTLLFLIINACFAGLMLAVCLAVSTNRIIYRAPVLYFDIDIKLLVALTVICYLAVRLVFFAVRMRSPENKTARVVIGLGQRTLCADALIDSGHSLRDAYSGASVAVADLKSFKSLTGYEAGELLKLSEQGKTTDFKLRLIPVNTVASKGLLTAVKADYIVVDGKKSDKNLFVAQSNTDFFTDEYSLILNNDFL